MQAAQRRLRARWAVTETATCPPRRPKASRTPRTAPPGPVRGGPYSPGMVLAALLDALAAARSDGLDFDTAWPDGLAAALRAAERWERGDWACALGATQDAWRMAYGRRAPRSAEQALQALEDPDRETVDVPERECDWCGGTIATRDPRARFCSSRCRHRGSEERTRARAAA